MRERVQGPGPEHKEHRVVMVNLKRGRLVPKHHKPFNVHRSVKIRMGSDHLPGGKYTPKAQFVQEPTWVG